MTVGSNNKVKKVHVFGVETRDFTFKALVPSKTLELLLYLLPLLMVLLTITRAVR